MSTQRSSSNRYGNGTVSGALSRGGPSAPSPAGPFTKGYGSGLVSLGTAKKPRTASSLADRKLSVPKPVNLPSLRKENAGNDPNTQLVPSGGGGGWQKPDSAKEEVEEQAPIITAGSSWASAPSNSGVPSWQPPQPFPVAASAAARPRSLNPHEYPSLSAAASAKQSSAVKQPVPHVPSAGSQGGGNWDEDERKPVFGGAQSRLSSESWADSRPEDEDRPPSRPPWESSALNGRPDWRGPAGDATNRNYSDDHWVPKLQPRFPPRAGFSSQDRFREVEDPTLFPPPPPPRQPPPPPPPKAEQTREEVEAEKRAFEEEIDRVIEDERRRKREMQEADRLRALEAEAEERAAMEKAQASATPPPPPPMTEEQQAAAAEAAKQKVIALRKQREEEAQAAEKKRKEAAQAKLKELEERIARKKAELEAKTESEAVNAEPEPTAEEVLSGVEEAVNDVLEASADAAVEAADKAAATTATPTIAHIMSREPTTGQASSVEAEAGSSIGGQEASLELQGMESMIGSEATAAPEGDDSWAKGAPANQPTNIWQRKDKPEGEKRPEAEEDAMPEQSDSQPGDTGLQQGNESGAGSLFTDTSGFGPSLVATSLGIPKDSPAAATQALTQLEKPAVSGAPLSWRAVLGGPNVEAVAPSLKPEEVAADGHSIESGGPGRGRGRGRARREHAPREDKQETGGRGEKGRGKERGRGRGRGRNNRQEGAAKDDASVTSASQSFSENGIAVPPEGQQQRPPKQRGQGRGRGKGELDGRGRGRNNRVQNGIQQPESSSAPAKPHILPPGITPAASQPTIPSLESGKASVSQAEARPGETWPVSIDSQDLPPISNLNLSKPPGVFTPALDPLVNIGPDARSDRAIDRPKSAAGAVARPKSSKVDSLLPNGMPVLPNDLSLDGPRPDSDKPNPGSTSISFGFQPSSNTSTFSPGPFPGVYFSGQPGGHNPWQPSAPHNMQKNLSEAINSFNNAAGSSSLGQAPSQGGSSQPQSQSLQFGAFGGPNFPQFGQLTDFGQSPFIRTGKQPDWSTGPINAAPGASTGLKPPEPLTGSMHAAFPQSRGMDAVLPQGSLQKRGLQIAPGPPGLQRQSQPGPGAGPGFPNGAPAGLSSMPQQAPPGLQGPPPQVSFAHFPNMAAGISQPQPPVMVDFSTAPTHMMQQGPPPGIGSRGPPLSRDQPPNLPDDVFDTAETKLQAGNAIPHSQLAPNNQARRGVSDGRGRGGRGGRAPPQGRAGRAFGRGQHQQAGRGGPPQPQIPGPPPNNPRFQGIPVEGTGIPQQGFGQGRGAPLHPPQHGHMGHFGVPVAGPGVPGHMKGRGIQSERGKGRGRGDRGQQPLGPRQSLDGSQAGSGQPRG